MIGHQHTEHGDGVHVSSKLIFKELRASWSRGGRGAGPNSTDLGGGDGTELAAAVDSDLNRKRDTDTRQEFPPATTLNQLALPGVGVVPPSPSSQDPKRTRTAVNSASSGQNKNNSVSSSAGSQEGLRRDQ